MGPRSFAFLSFLDLISCAFGAAVLLSLVAMTDDKSKVSPDSVADVMLITYRRTQGEDVEVHFVIRDPHGRVVRTTDVLPTGYVCFTGEADDRDTSFLVIPKPAPGKWTFQTYWANESIHASGDAVVQVTIRCPRLKQGTIATVSAQFGATQRFSEEVAAEIVDRDETGNPAR